jgi:hypothetical protein
MARTERLKRPLFETHRKRPVAPKRPERPRWSNKTNVRCWSGITGLDYGENGLTACRLVDIGHPY